MVLEEIMAQKLHKLLYELNIQKNIGNVFTLREKHVKLRIHPVENHTFSYISICGCPKAHLVHERGTGLSRKMALSK